MAFWRSGDNANPGPEKTVDRAVAPPEGPGNGAGVRRGGVQRPVPFVPINFRDPESWEKLPNDALPEKVDPDVEPRVLAALVLAKARRALWAARSDAADDDVEALAELPANLKATTPSGLADWVAYRFQHPLTDSVERGKRQRSLLLGLSIGTSGAGLAASALAVLGGNGQWAVSGSGSVSRWALLAAAAGVLVGVLTAIIQILKPAQRSVASYQLTHTLRHEGWDYVSGRGRYRVPSGVEALDLFIDEVNRIQRAVEAIDETTVDITHESKSTS